MALLWRVIFSTWSTHLIETTVLSRIYRQVSIYTSTYNIYSRSSSCFLIFVVFFLLFLYYHSSPSPFLPTSSWSTGSCSFHTCKWIRSQSLQVSSLAPFHVPAICTLTWFLRSHEMFPNIHKMQISASYHRKKYIPLTMYNVIPQTPGTSFSLQVTTLVARTASVHTLSLTEKIKNFVRSCQKI